MSSGKPDYWRTTYNSLPMPVGGQYPFMKYDNAVIASDDSEAVITYTVPVNRILYLTNVQCYCRSLAINNALLYNGAVRLVKYTMITNLIVTLNDSSIIEIGSGETVILYVQNNDIFEVTFDSALQGFEIAV